MRANALRRITSSWIIVAVALLFSLPMASFAQSGYPPSITFSVSGSVASPSITIYWCVPTDPEQFNPPQLNAGSRQILLNGVNVTSSFSYAGASQENCVRAAVSSGSVTSAPGTNYLQASISDMSGRSTTESTSWTVAPDRLPAVVDMGGNPGDYRDPSKCVVACFENVFTYSMPT